MCATIIPNIELLKKQLAMATIHNIDIIEMPLRRSVRYIDRYTAQEYIDRYEQPKKEI